MQIQRRRLWILRWWFSWKALRSVEPKFSLCQIANTSGTNSARPVSLHTLGSAWTMWLVIGRAKSCNQSYYFQSSKENTEGSLVPLKSCTVLLKETEAFERLWDLKSFLINRERWPWEPPPSWKQTVWQAQILGILPFWSATAWFWDWQKCVYKFQKSAATCLRPYCFLYPLRKAYHCMTVKSSLAEESVLASLGCISFLNKEFRIHAGMPLFTPPIMQW